MRTIIGLSGIAALSALATAVSMPTVPTDAATTTVQTQVVPAPSVVHVTQYVHLKPGQTAPPSATVQAAPAPTPRIVVVTTTRQSGTP